MEVSGQLHVPLLVLTGQEDGWAPEPVWTRWREEISQSLPKIEPPVVQLLAQSLYRLSYEKSC